MEGQALPRLSTRLRLDGDVVNSPLPRGPNAPHLSQATAPADVLPGDPAAEPKRPFAVRAPESFSTATSSPKVNHVIPRFRSLEKMHEEFNHLVATSPIPKVLQKKLKDFPVHSQFAPDHQKAFPQVERFLEFERMHSPAPRNVSTPQRKPPIIRPNPGSISVSRHDPVADLFAVQSHRMEFSFNSHSNCAVANPSSSHNDSPGTRTFGNHTPSHDSDVGVGNRKVRGHDISEASSKLPQPEFTEGEAVLVDEMAISSNGSIQVETTHNDSLLTPKPNSPDFNQEAFGGVESPTHSVQNGNLNSLHDTEAAKANKEESMARISSPDHNSIGKESTQKQDSRSKEIVEPPKKRFFAKRTGPKANAVSKSDTTQSKSVTKETSRKRVSKPFDEASSSLPSPVPSNSPLGDKENAVSPDAVQAEELQDSFSTPKSRSSSRSRRSKPSSPNAPSSQLKPSGKRNANEINSDMELQTPSKRHKPSETRSQTESSEEPTHGRKRSRSSLSADSDAEAVSQSSSKKKNKSVSGSATPISLKEESILFESWGIHIPEDSSTLKATPLYIVGSLGNGNELRILVNSRVSEFCFKDSESKIYKLQGSLNKSLSDKWISTDLLDEFENGFPLRWRTLIRKHLQNQRSQVKGKEESSTKEKSFKETPTKKKSNPSTPASQSSASSTSVRRSSRERHKPVDFWKNERIINGKVIVQGAAQDAEWERIKDSPTPSLRSQKSPLPHKQMLLSLKNPAGTPKTSKSKKEQSKLTSPDVKTPKKILKTPNEKEIVSTPRKGTGQRIPKDPKDSRPRSSSRISQGESSLKTSDSLSFQGRQLFDSSDNENESESELI